MKLFLATWILSWADLIDTIVEVLSLGLVLQTDAAHVVYLNAVEAMLETGWIGLGELP